MDDGTPALEVGFLIDTGDSFNELRLLQELSGSTEVKIAADAAKTARATRGMVDLAGATASMTAFGNAATRELQSTAREAARLEKAGERMVAQLERQNAAFGKSRSELRAMRAEELAQQAARVGNADLAERIRTQEQALYAQEFAAMRRAKATADELASSRITDAENAAKEAAAVRDAAEAHRLFEAVAKQRMGEYRAQEAIQAAAATARETAAVKAAAEEHARLVTLVRGSHDAQLADAQAAERLRESTDPLYAAMKRLNDEIAESTRLYHAGATAEGEYQRQQEVLAGRMRALGAVHDEAAGKMGKSNFALKQTALQIPDIVQGLLTGQKPLTVFLQQGGQIAQIAQMAEGGIKGFAVQIGSLALRFTPLIAATAVAGVALYRWKEQINDSAGLKKFADGLGLTHKEMKKLGDVSVTSGDLIAGVWKTISDSFSLGGSGKKLLDYLFSPDDARQVQTFLSQIYGVFVGGYNAIVELWGQIAPAVSGFISRAAAAAMQFFKPLIDAAQWAASGISQVFSTIYNWVADRVRAMGQFIAPVLSAIGLDKAAAAMSSAGSKLGSTFGNAYAKAAQQFVTGTNNFAASVAANAVSHAQERLKTKADTLKADRTPKTDHHAEQLAREAEATEAQIRNLYRLADAYKVSDAAAFIAEARVKAESAAIKQRGDIEETVNRQIALAIAQRVSDAAKATAAMQHQADAQASVNAMVAAGLVPAERAAQMVQDQIADVPLLAAAQAAQQRGLVEEAKRATGALEDQRAARARLAKADSEARINVSLSAGNDQLAMLREELRLIGATDDARARSLAELKAWQEVAGMPGLSPDKAAAYVRLQGDIAVQTVANAQAQDAYNASLTLTADKWDIIGEKVQSAAAGMADAFGGAGRAVGDLASIYANFMASRARADVEHERAIVKAGKNETLVAQENARFALRQSGLQVAAYGDMAAAAKGFFKEGSDGYKALQKAEQVFRAVQFALSVRAIAQDAIETASSIAKSGARTAVAATEAVVNAIKSLPFPLNLVAGAATIAALASIGVAIGGSFGGSKNNLPKANAGTGTALGDTSAQSESIKRSIDGLAQIDDATLTVSRNMLASLRSIENSLGGVASQIVRAGNVNADGSVATGFNKNIIGDALSSLNKVPVLGIVGAVLGPILGKLFGTKTTVIGGGIYGGAQSLGDILSGGFDGQTYSDVQKKKKLFGITTSTKYSTVYGGLDDQISDQFTLLLKQFYTSIAAAAGPLGAATGEIENRLNGFVLNIGKIDLNGLSGQEIQDKLSAVFGAAADQMAEAAIPGLDRFQKVGEGAFETLVRVSSTVEQVDAVFQRLGRTTGSMGIGIDMALADMFDSVSDFVSLSDTYFEKYYTGAEQAAAKTAQLARAFGGLGVAMPDTLADFRRLVEAQDLSTAAGQQMYATLLQLAPAFADLKTSMDGAKSAADILSERQDLLRQLYQLQGNTAAIRAVDLEKIDASNRALQQQVWAIQDAQAAADAADQLRQAWASVGDGILDEIKRIRGLNATATGGSYAMLLGQFNAATSAARRGDMDAAKSLAGLSKSMLDAAATQATSLQELNRVRALAAASLEDTYAAIGGRGGQSEDSIATTLAAISASQESAASAADDTVTELQALRAELAQMRSENNSGHAATAGNTGSIKKTLDAATETTGGTAIAVAFAA